MFRGHVPPVQASKAHAIVILAGKKRATLRVCWLAEWAYFLVSALVASCRVD
jgi:hypothetical protein